MPKIDTRMSLTSVMSANYETYLTMAKILKDDYEASITLSHKTKFKVGDKVEVDFESLHKKLPSRTRKSVLNYSLVSGIVKEPSKIELNYLKELTVGMITKAGVSLYDRPVYEIRFGQDSIVLFEQYLKKSEFK
jgi:hypothetical protein